MSDLEHTEGAVVTAGDAGRRFWSEQSGSYVRGIDGPYHEHRLAVVKRLLEPCSRSGGRAVDLGCGDGVLAGWLAGRGLDVVGIDMDEGMVAAARHRLAQERSPAQVLHGGVDRLEGLRGGVR